MNINLGTQWEKYVNQTVKSGRYVSASEVVRDALRLLKEQEQVRQIRLEELRKEIKKGADALDRGEYLELDRAGLKRYFDDVIKRGHERLAKKRAASK